MNKWKIMFEVLCLGVFLQIIFTPNAFAYIDLGTGSYLFQMLMAGLFGSLFVMKSAWRNIKLYLARWFSGNSPDRDEQD